MQIIPRSISEWPLECKLENSFNYIILPRLNDFQRVWHSLRTNILLIWENLQWRQCAFTCTFVRPSVRHHKSTKHFVGVLLKHVIGILYEKHSDSLRVGRSGDRIPVRARFSAPVQTGTGAHPPSYTVGTGSFPGVKRPGRGVDHPPTSSAEVKERVVRGWTISFT